jgi:hypothetical protein
MKNNKTKLIIVAMTLLMAACTKEPAELTINIEPDSNLVDAGNSVTFSINGNYEFLTFYSGLKGYEWENYPASRCVSVDLPEGSNTFLALYNDTNGIVVSKFIATSYGNWGEEVITEIIEFEIKVNDNRTGISSVRIRYPENGSNKSAKGEISNDEGIVRFEVGTGADLSNVEIQSITPVSSKAKVFYNDKELTGSIKLDFESATPKFRILAANGETTQDFTFAFIKK